LFDYMIVNDELDQAKQRLRSIVLAELSRRARMAMAAEALLQQVRAEGS
jgi:guanylate kinase